ncbi:MAG: hypothetical protein MR407_09120, partial [Roseburia sp.]|nr:hypothetical protein [Roseburia sp.]
MEYCGIIALVLLLCYSAYPRKVKRLEAKVKRLEKKQKVQLINVNKKFKKYRLYFRTKKGRTYPLVKISCFKKDIDSGNSVFYA